MKVKTRFLMLKIQNKHTDGIETKERITRNDTLFTGSCIKMPSMAACPLEVHKWPAA